MCLEYSQTQSESMDRIHTLDISEIANEAENKYYFCSSSWKDTYLSSIHVSKAQLSRRLTTHHNPLIIQGPFHTVYGSHTWTLAGQHTTEVRTTSRDRTSGLGFFPRQSPNKLVLNLIVHAVLQIRVIVVMEYNTMQSTETYKPFLEVMQKTRAVEGSV